MSDHVAAVNKLTASWVGRYSAGSGVLSGAGLWPLLAILCASADEPGRSELAEAVGLEPDETMDAARLVLSAMDEVDGVDAALGLWAQRAAGVRAEWRAELPPGTYGELSGDATKDQPALDAWAVERTRGLIERFPIDIHPDLMVILATALALKTTWVRKFTESPVTPTSGPWVGRQVGGLTRTTNNLDDLCVADTEAGPITLVRVEGDNGIDVHLALGADEMSASTVLANAVPSVTSDETSGVRSGSQLLADRRNMLGPGIAIVPSTRENLALTTVQFTVRSDHDLMEHLDVFGLTTVSRPGAHFARVSDVPLCVEQARQSAVAKFYALGFEAAAVTTIGIRAVSLPVYNANGLAVTIDRPFGFVASHRDSRLALFAGWVDTPEPALAG